MAVTMLQLHQGIRLICSNLLQSLSLYSPIQLVKRIFLRTSFEIQIKQLPSTKYLERELNYFPFPFSAILYGTSNLRRKKRSRV